MLSIHSSLYPHLLDNLIECSQVNLCLFLLDVSLTEVFNLMHALFSEHSVPLDEDILILFFLEILDECHLFVYNLSLCLLSLSGILSLHLINYLYYEVVRNECLQYTTGLSW